MKSRFKSISVVDGRVKIDIDGKGIAKKVDKAQKWLDNRVMTDMLPYMPLNTGMFIANTQSISRSLAGTGLVCAGAPPMGRYLYYGKVMVDSVTGRGAIPIQKDGELIFRFRRGAVLVPTDRNLKYGRASATAQWFETAKDRHYEQWVDGVRRIINGR